MGNNNVGLCGFHSSSNSGVRGGKSAFSDYGVIVDRVEYGSGGHAAILNARGG